MTLTTLDEERNFRKFEILTVELLKIRAFWDSMVLISNAVSKDCNTIIFMVKQSQKVLTS